MCVWRLWKSEGSIAVVICVLFPQLCQEIKILCKDDMPKDRLNFHEDFHVFHNWWMTNVFPECLAQEVSIYIQKGHVCVQEESDK